MSLYQSIKISIKHPDTGKVFELNCFCKSPMSQKEFWEIFNENNKLEKVLLAPKISQPMEANELASFEGFIPFVEALEAEGSE